MSQIKLEAPFRAFRGKICKHSDIIYKKLRQTNYTSQICNPRTKPFTAAETARQTKFKTAVTNFNRLISYKLKERKPLVSFLSLSHWADSNFLTIKPPHILVVFTE